MIKPVVVIGTGGLGREVLEVLKKSLHHKQKILGFIDDNQELHGVMVNDYPVLGGCEWFKDNPETLAVCGIGDNRTRMKVTKRVEDMGIEFTNAVHPNADIGDVVKIGKGVVITSGVTITCNIDIGNHVYLNLDCTVGHDCILEDYVNICPGVHLSGNCTLQKGCHIYTGAILFPGVTIGKWAEIGAGAVVREDVEDYAVAVASGVLAKTIKYREYDDE